MTSRQCLYRFILSGIPASHHDRSYSRIDVWKPDVLGLNLGLAETMIQFEVRSKLCIAAPGLMLSTAPVTHRPIRASLRGPHASDRG
jgi:hypothetical protein